MSTAELILLVTALVLAGQLYVFYRQLRVFEAQTVVAQEQARWRRDEAIGTFYRTAFDLATELRKTDGVHPTEPLLVIDNDELPAVDYSAHPRQVLRTASQQFAPLGNAVVMATVQAAMELDDYFKAVADYPSKNDVGERQECINEIRSCKKLVGRFFDLANGAIPGELRWKKSGGEDFNFSKMLADSRDSNILTTRHEPSTPPETAKDEP